MVKRSVILCLRAISVLGDTTRTLRLRGSCLQAAFCIQGIWLFGIRTVLCRSSTGEKILSLAVSAAMPMFVCRTLTCIGGENISSLALESVIVTHPDVLEAAVVAIKDEKWGERPKAFLTVKEGKTLQSEELILWMKSNPKISGFVRFMNPILFACALEMDLLTDANRWFPKRQK